MLLADGGTLRRIDARTGFEDPPLIRSDHEILEAAISPDEKLVAFTTYPGSDCAGSCAGADGGSLVVVDSQTKRVQLELHADDARFRDSLGSPGSVHWLSNSNFMLVMSRFSSSLGSAYLIDLPDGRSTKLPRTPLLVDGRSHVGVYVADPPKRVGCYDWAALEAADLVTGAVLFSVGGAGSGLNPVEFSPDGREVLLAATKWPPDTPVKCADPPLESRLLLVAAATGATQDVSDADALRRAWYGAAFLGWSCPPGLSDRRGNSSFSCNGAGELSLGGTVIPASSARVVTVAE
ncbi:MAG: hypothetical protein IH609_04790 [Dehalococcoidia bacterium]|nr:hypothetical protein [Dehalococcoidia bacterium]